LWVRSLEDTDARQLVGTEDAYEPFWSPDGLWLAFSAQDKLKKVAAGGGPVRVVTDSVPEMRGASWNVDDTIIYGTGFSSLYRVSAAGGSPAPITELDVSKQEGSHRWPQFLPDGRHFLFTVRSGVAEHRGVYVGSLTDKVRHFVMRSDANVSFVPPDYLLFLDGDSVLGHHFDLDRLELKGQPITIATKVGRSSNGNGAFSASSNTLVYSASMLHSGRLAWFDRQGTRLEWVGPEGFYSDFRLSPDGKRLAASIVDPIQGVLDIWLTDLARGGTSRFTFGPGPAINAAPAWSPDGERIAFRSNRKGLIEFYQKRVADGGTEELLLSEGAQRAAGLASTTQFPTDWSPDGRSLVLSANVPSDLWLLQPASKRLVNIVAAPFDQAHANFSRDGRLIAYSSNESGKYEVYVQSFPQFDRKWLISTNGGSEPRWSSDGRELYYLSEDQKLMAVAVGSGSSPFGAPRMLFQTSIREPPHLLRTHFVPDHDARRFLVYSQSGDSSPVPMTVVLNWNAGIQPSVRY
jgi:Tol biopolymer transport system component